MRAAYILAYQSSAANEWVGLEYLYTFFKSNFFYTEPDPIQVCVLCFFPLSSVL
jgi:hypothetical protein